MVNRQEVRFLARQSKYTRRNFLLRQFFHTQSEMEGDSHGRTTVCRQVRRRLDSPGYFVYEVYNKHLYRLQGAIIISYRRSVIAIPISQIYKLTGSVDLDVNVE